MHAVVITTPGGPEILVWTEVPDPEAGPGEVLVAGRGDRGQPRRPHAAPGLLPAARGHPAWPGLECSGTVLATGAGVVGWAAGDEVCALLAGGGYAERVAVPAGQLMPVPTGVDLVSAAALPEVVCTVWSNVFMLAGLQPGEALLVHGGASGIGTMATQLAAALGARVAVTAARRRSSPACAALGADVLVNYREQDFVEEVRAATRVAVQTWCSTHGGVLPRSQRRRARGQRAARGHRPAGRRSRRARSRHALGKRAAVLATTLRHRPVDEKAAIVASVSRTSGRWSPPAGCARSSTGCCP